MTGPALQSAFGLIVLLVIAWGISENRRAVPWRIVLSGVALTLLLAVLLLKVPPVQQFFLALNDGLLALERATQAGTSLVFGYLGGAPLPFETRPSSSTFILALRALPLVLVVSALSALLFYWRVLPWLVRLLSAVLEKTLGIGGAVGLSTAANIFIGMVEAPLVVRPYLAKLSRGTVHRDDLRHGRRCGNGDGALCEHPRTGGTGCHRPYSRGVDHLGAGGNRGRGPDGTAAGRTDAGKT